VGIGEKAGKAVIKVFVTHKVPESALQPQEIVPKRKANVTVGTIVQKTGRTTNYTTG